MSVTFDRRSVKIEPHLELAKPDVFLADTQRVHCHLTRGFNSNRICQQGHGDAILAFGSINVAAGPGELKDWQFGFVQVVQLNVVSEFYAGRTRKEGSIGIQSHVPPAMGRRLLLDSATDVSPWISRTGFPSTPPNVKELMEDHPSACVPKSIDNDNTKRPNFLFHLITEYEFWSTFCARDPKGKLEPFGHFHWLVRYEFRFNWRSQGIAVAGSSSLVKSDPVVIGPPPQPDVRAILTNPAGQPFANDVLNAARHSVSKNSPNRADNDTWFGNVPRDFFQ